jgi:hypothetical protein
MTQPASSLSPAVDAAGSGGVSPGTAAAEAFCFVAEKNGRWFGVISGGLPSSCIEDFYREFAGYAIAPLATRGDWDAYRNSTPAFGG